MSEATSIDKLSIEIETNSSKAADGIEELAIALGDLKNNGKISTAVKNIGNLADALKKLTPVTSNANKLSALANSVNELSKAGSFARVVNQLNKLPGALKGLSSLNIDNGLGTKLEKLAQATTPLSNIKTGGLGTMVNALGKIGDVTAKLDDATIGKFADRVKKLNTELEPLSNRMTTIQAGLRGINSSAKRAGGGFREFGSRVNATRLNLASLVTVVQGAISVLMPLVRLFSSTISEAIEWDGIAARFGRGFGDQAGEIYAWVQRLNEEMGINVQQFMQYSSVFSTMLQGFGVGTEDSAKMALGYTELIYDIWAGYNDVYKNFDDAADAVKSAIAGEVEPIRRAGFTIVESTLEQTAANHGLEISLENATEAQKSYLRYLTLVDQAHAQNLVGTYARELNTAEGLMRTFAQQLKSLAQAFGSLFLPILVKVMPWLQAFVNLLTEAIAAVAAFFGIELQPVSWGGGSGGMSSGLADIGSAADTATDSLGGTADAVDKTTDALKDLKKATIGIDELNVISPPTSNKGSGGSGGGGAGGIGGGLGGFEDLGVGSLWDESIFDQIQFEVDKIKDLLKEALTMITAIVSGFMLAIGTILVVSGANIPLGLALMAVGAIGLVAVIAENWNGMSDKLAKTLTIVTAVLGGFLLAIGAFLAFSGVNVGLGAALMVAGAVSLATAATINWKFLNGDMKNALSIITGIISGALLALGALFTFTGVSPGLGVSLMVAGAVGLATTVALNWDSMPNALRKVIADLTTIVSNGAIALGAMLAFSGVNVPIGMALMAVGAIGLVAAEQLNWDSTTSQVRRTLTTLIQFVSSAMLGVGAVLAFSGVNVPLGVALLAAGAVGLSSGTSINWSLLTNKVKTVLKEIGAALGVALLAVGAVLAFSGVAMPLGISLMAAGAVSLVSAVALNWDAIVSPIKNILQTVGMIGGASLLALGLILALSGVAMPLGIGLIAAGAASFVGGVAMNWNAIVDLVNRTVDKIAEAWGRLWDACTGAIQRVVDGVVGAFQKLFDVLVGHSIVPDTIDGIVDCFTGMPGDVLGVVKNFVGNVVDKFSDFGSDVVGKVSSGWNTVKSWWKGKSNLETAQVGVSLVKKGWSTVKGWIGSIPGVSQAVSLAKSGWSTVKKWVGNIPTLSQLVKLGKSGWSSVKSWIGKIPTLSQGIKLSKSGWSSVKKWVGNIPTMSAGIKLVKSGWSSVKSWLGNLNFKLGFSLPRIGVNWGTKSVAGFKISYPKGFYTYAKGGFPDFGELFIAREAGPEMVGKIGNKTSVANNDQIVEAVSEGVYAAVLAAMRQSEGNGAQSVNVYLDGRQLTSAVEKRQRERGANVVRNSVYAY